MDHEIKAITRNAKKRGAHVEQTKRHVRISKDGQTTIAPSTGTRSSHQLTRRRVEKILTPVVPGKDVVGPVETTGEPVAVQPTRMASLPTVVAVPRLEPADVRAYHLDEFIKRTGCWPRKTSTDAYERLLAQFLSEWQRDLARGVMPVKWALELDSLLPGWRIRRRGGRAAQLIKDVRPAGIGMDSQPA